MAHNYKYSIEREYRICKCLQRMYIELTIIDPIKLLMIRPKKYLRIPNAGAQSLYRL